MGNIAIGEITDKAEVNKAIYYRHFELKQHIIKYYYAGILSEYVDALDPYPEVYSAANFDQVNRLENYGLKLIFQ